MAEHSAANLKEPSAPPSPSGGPHTIDTTALEKEPGELQWPLTWLNDAAAEVWRVWGRGPLFTTPDHAGEAGKPASAKQPRKADPQDKADPPTSIDRLVHASMGRFTLGLAPSALRLAYADWAIHFWESRGKREQLAEKALGKTIRLLTYLSQLGADQSCPPCIEPLPQDRRFDGDAWKRWPFNLIYQAFLLNQQWWHSAMTGIGGVSPHHEQVVAFMTRQLLDTVSPVNFIATNPDVLVATVREGGQNLVRGAMNFWADWERTVSGKAPIGAESFQPGAQVAATKGEVVYRNRLIELIQYAPTTSEVHAEPVLIVPAWIMKYYIPDLSPGNSLVKYLVDAGYTVFMISWHNPTVEDRDLGLNDYLRLGILDALKAIESIVPDRKVNAAGYCLGGTLLSISAAYLAHEGASILNSVTLLAAQTDFTEAGELMLFIDNSQLNYLEDIMWNQGYLDTKQMAGAFQMLRSNDLVWSLGVQEYLMGQRAPMTDLMAWNADTTRLPYRMQSEYLRRLFLENELFEGRYQIEGRPIALEDIRVPIFAVSTERDHVAPWHSVYKINLVGSAEVTFVLTSGGHNAGIVSEPGHQGRHYRISRHAADAQYLDPETWYAKTKPTKGSWWPTWLAWLERVSPGRASNPALGAADKGYPPLEPAPGLYVLER